MTQEDFPLPKVFNQLPHSLQMRFSSLGKYVDYLILEQESVYKGSERISLNERQYIKLVAFSYSLDRFFRMGTLAAKEASESFQDFGLKGFQVGTTIFEPDNSNTLRGEELAEALFLLIREIPEIQGAKTIKELVKRLVRNKLYGQE